MSEALDLTATLHPRMRNLCGIVALEGNIGAGKSTVMDLLRVKFPTYKGCKVVYVKEPSARWERTEPIPPEYLAQIPKAQLKVWHPQSALQQFYSDQRKHAFSFQVYAFTTRAAVIWDAIRDVVRGDERYIIVTERSALSDKEVFVYLMLEMGLWSPSLIAPYDMFWNLVAGAIVEHIKGIIHLYTTPKLCSERIRARDRSAEADIPLDYLRRIDQKTTQMLNRHRDGRVCITVDWNKSLSEPGTPERLFAAVETIFNHVTK